MAAGTILTRKRAPRVHLAPFRPPQRTSRRRALQTGARTAVVVGLVLFAAWQLGLSGVVEVAHPEWRDPTFEIKYRPFAQLLARQAQPPRMVFFLGSSMTAHGIKADVVDAVASEALGAPAIGYNFGINLSGPFSHLVYLQRLLRRGARPDLVVVELSPLLYDLKPRDAGRLPAATLEYGDLDTLERCAQPPDLRSEWWESHLVPVHGYRLAILNQMSRGLVPYEDRIDLWTDMDDHGWRVRRVRDPQSLAATLKTVEKSFKARLQQYKIDAEAIRMLDELMEFIDREHIPCVLMVAPAGPTFRTFYRPGALDQIMAEFRARSERHGYPLVDASTWCGEEEFIDSHHLNERGAVKLTDRLVRETIVPMLTSVRR